MRPIAIPEQVSWPGTKRQQVEGGHPNVDDIEVLIGRGKFSDVDPEPHVFSAMLIHVGPDDLDRLQRDPHFWLIVHADHLTPMSIEVGMQPGPEIGMPAPRVAVSWTKDEIDYLLQYVDAEFEMKDADGPFRDALAKLLGARNALEEQARRQREAEITHGVGNGHKNVRRLRDQSGE